MIGLRELAYSFSRFTRLGEEKHEDFSFPTPLTSYYISQLTLDGTKSWILQAIWVIPTKQRSFEITFDFLPTMAYRLKTVKYKVRFAVALKDRANLCEVASQIQSHLHFVLCRNKIIKSCYKMKMVPVHCWPPPTSCC
jgi:hypothetical protein